MISQKCRYALRAVFELAKRYGGGPVKINEIAEIQAIPPRFLEIILNQLRQAGFVSSRRGAAGGYELVKNPATLTAGEIIRFIEGPIGPVACGTKDSSENCPLYGDCAFIGMWEKAQKAVAAVYDGTTFQDLINEERSKKTHYVECYSI